MGTPPPERTVLVLYGPKAVGKSQVADVLQRRLGVHYVDADRLVLDLLAAGVPVVAEAVGQNKEYIRHGETGLLVEPGDVEAFADAIVQLLEDAPLREKLGRAAARDVREWFGWDRLVEKVVQSYS